MPLKSRKVEVDGKDVIILSPRREAFAQHYGHGMEGPAAMLRAGYAESVVAHKGMSWMMQDELLVQRIEQIQTKLMGGIREEIRGELLRIPRLLEKAINYMEKVLDGKDIDGKKFVGEQHAVRVALRVLGVGEALMIAEIPRRLEVYRVSIVKMRQEVVDARLSPR